MLQLAFVLVEIEIFSKTKANLYCCWDCQFGNRLQEAYMEARIKLLIMFRLIYFSQRKRDLIMVIAPAVRYCYHLNVKS